MAFNPTGSSSSTAGLFLTPAQDLVEFHLRDSGNSTSRALGDDLVLLLRPARTALNVLAEGIDRLGGHVAELALLERHEAGADRPSGPTEARGRVLCLFALDQARVLFEAAGEASVLLVDGAALLGAGGRGGGLLAE